MRDFVERNRFSADGARCCRTRSRQLHRATPVATTRRRVRAQTCAVDLPLPEAHAATVAIPFPPLAIHRPGPSKFRCVWLRARQCLACGHRAAVRHAAVRGGVVGLVRSLGTRRRGRAPPRARVRAARGREERRVDEHAHAMTCVRRAHHRHHHPTRPAAPNSDWSIGGARRSARRQPPGRHRARAREPCRAERDRRLRRRRSGPPSRRRRARAVRAAAASGAACDPTHRSAAAPAWQFAK